MMLCGGGVSNYYVVSVGGREYVKGRRYMFLPMAGTHKVDQAWGGGGGGAAICAAVA